MTKYVFTNFMTVHVWAQQTRDTARNGNDTISFRGTTLYSYSTAIANFVKDKDGNKIVLLSEKRYSPTTDRHIHAAQSASSQYPQFYVDNLLSTAYYKDTDQTDINEQHLKNVNGMVKRYHKEIARLNRTMQRRPWAEQYLRARSATFRSYADTFGFTLVEWPDVDADWKKLCERWDRLEAKRNDPKEIAKKQRAQDKKEKKMREEYRTLQGKFGPRWRVPWRTREYFEALFSEDDKAQRNTAIQKLYADKLAGWREGEDTIEYWDFPREMITDADRTARANALKERDAAKLVQWRNGEAVETDNIRDIITEEDRIARDAALRQQPGTLSNLAVYLNGDAYSPPYDLIITDEEKIQREENLKHKHARDIERWRAGEVSSYSVRMQTRYALLRVQGTKIETSHGAEFPVDHAIKAYRLLKVLHDAGKTYHRNGHSIHLGHFVVDAFEDGIVRAGCHTVEWAEIENCAKALGIAS